MSEINFLTQAWGKTDQRMYLGLRKSELHTEAIMNNSVHYTSKCIDVHEKYGKTDSAAGREADSLYDKI